MNAMETEIDCNRNAVIARIRVALKRRSGKMWSVTGGRGTAWGWIRIDAPPARCTWGTRLKAGAVSDRPEDYEEYEMGPGEIGGHMSPADRAELGRLLGNGGPVHFQGRNIPASNDHYREYVERAEGLLVSKVAEAYWD